MSFGAFLAKNFGNAGLQGFANAQMRNLKIRDMQIAQQNALRDREQAETADTENRVLKDSINSQTLDPFNENPVATDGFGDLKLPEAEPTPPQAGLGGYSTYGVGAGMTASGPAAGVTPSAAAVGAPAVPAAPADQRMDFSTGSVRYAVEPRPTSVNTNDMGIPGISPVARPGFTDLKRERMPDKAAANNQKLRNAQAEWDKKYAATHTPDGKPKLSNVLKGGWKPSGHPDDWNPATAGGPKSTVARPAVITQSVAQAAQTYGFAAIEQKYGLPAGYLTNTLAIENPAADPSIKNKAGSNALGLFQFMPKTAAQYGVDPLDPVSSAEGAAKYAVDNANALRTAIGRDPAPWEIYMAHQQGAAGATALLMNPTRKATSVVGRIQVLQNGGTENMTAQEFLQVYATKFNATASGVAPTGGQQQAIGGVSMTGVSGGPTQTVMQATAPVKPAQILKDFKPGSMTDPGGEYKRAVETMRAAELQYNDLRQRGGSPQAVMALRDKVEQLRLVAKRTYHEQATFAMANGDPAMIDGALSEATGAQIRHAPLDNGNYAVFVNGQYKGESTVETITNQVRRFWDQQFAQQWTEADFKASEQNNKVQGEIILENVKASNALSLEQIKGALQYGVALVGADATKFKAIMDAQSAMDVKRLDVGGAKLVGIDGVPYYVVPSLTGNPADAKVYRLDNKEMDMDGTKVQKPVKTLVQ